MKKVKFFSGSDKTANELEKQINEFCASHRVVDIQYQSFPVYAPGRDNKTIRSIDAYSRVMVVYEIEDECERECNNCAFSGFAPWSYPCNGCVKFSHWRHDVGDIHYCLTCKHEYTLCNQEPCDNCKNGSKWEQKEDEKNEQAE